MTSNSVARRTCRQRMRMTGAFVLVLGIATTIITASFLAVPSAAFGQAGNAPSLDDLKQKYENEKELAYAQRISTITAIGNIKTDEAAAFLLQIARSETDMSVARQALSGIGRTGQTTYIAPLAAIFRTHDDLTMKLGALDGLGNFGNDAPLDVLMEAAENSNPSLSNAGINALTRANPADLDARLRRLVERTEGGPYTISSLLNTMARRKHPDTAALCQRFLAEWAPGNDSYRAQLVNALVLAGITPEHVNLLLACAIESDASSTSAAAKRALLDLSDEAHVKRLTDIGLAHNSAAAREVTAQALAKHTDKPGVLPAMIERFRRERENAVLIALMDSLAMAGESACTAAFSALMDQLRSRDDGVKMAALHALGHCQSKASDRELIRQLERFARGREEGPKCEAMIALARLGNGGAVDIAKRALRDREWRVRAAAVQALELSRSTAAIEALIDQMGQEDGRIRADILQALRSLTNKLDIPADQTVWRTWWNRHKDGFTVPPRGTAGQAQIAGTGFYGIEIHSKRVCFVLDVSGSMNAQSKFVPTGVGPTRPTRLDVLKHEVNRVLDHFRGQRDVKFNLIYFHSSIEPWKPSLIASNDRVLAEAREHNNGQAPRGATNIYDGLEMALLDPEVDTIFLMTDGEPNQGQFTSYADICREVQRLNRTRRVVIHTIGVELGRNGEQFLKELAAQNNGQFVSR